MLTQPHQVLYQFEEMTYQGHPKELHCACLLVVTAASFDLLGFQTSSFSIPVNPSQIEWLKHFLVQSIIHKTSPNQNSDWRGQTKDHYGTEVCQDMG